MTLAESPPPPSFTGSGERPQDDLATGFDARISAITEPADGVRELTLEALNDAPLPGWSPGAHVDVHLPGSLTRQYSLCGEPDRPWYRIAIRLDAATRGGSAAAHRLEPGQTIGISAPRNTFPFSPDLPAAVVLVGGGIGITALLPMLSAAQRSGLPVRVLYAGNTFEGMPYRDRVLALGPAGTLHASRVAGGRADLAAWLDATVTDLRRADGNEPPVDVYVCGPGTMAEDVRRSGSGLGVRSVRAEAFRAGPAAGDPAAGVPAAAFDVVLQRSGRTITVGPDESILDSLRRNGLRALSSCQEGVCGTCETAVLGGAVDPAFHSCGPF